jgi:nanoRNase/pAp phosphatase (c-di-AMP/oligoRNAs hydrolase)
MNEKSEMSKKEIGSIAEKNRIVRNIIGAMVERDGFLLIGHKNPDEDCIAAMVAFGLLASKFNKTAWIATCGQVQDQFGYLLSICRYNSIMIIEDCDDIPDTVTTIVALDTPKPSMLDRNPSIMALMDDESILKIEIDHHLEADSRYFGDEGYCLVTGASSASELVGLIAYKLEHDKALLAKHQIEEVFSRNFVLAVLTGIIGDSHMGLYIKTRRERWFYERFSTLFDRLLTQKTVKGTSNFTSKEEVFSAIASLSSTEENCYRAMMSHSRASEFVHSIVLDAADSAKLFATFGTDTVSSVTKSVADALAEESGHLSLVAYFDDPSSSNLVQFRMRRSHGFDSLDLRKVLEHFSFTNGGGHPGAVGFRFEKAEVPDIASFAERIILGVSEMIRNGDGA